MNQPRRWTRFALACATALMIGGCTVAAEKPLPPRYVDIANDPSLPSFLKGSIMEATRLENDDLFPISGWGLIVNLDGTGGSDQISNNLKAFMRKQLAAKGFGTGDDKLMREMTPERVLADKNVAVAAVSANLPPGARKGQWIDVYVSAERDEVSSLARGRLYNLQLTINGADPISPMLPVNTWALASGPVFVNPAVALKYTQNSDSQTKRTLRTGTIIGGGQVSTDRPLLLRLRHPDSRLARSIETRVNEYFHQDLVCRARDQGYCQLYVPEQYGTEWEHVAKLVQHIYMQGGSEAFARSKARELTAEAAKPNAPLQDISYCWEGLGINALPELSSILASPNTRPAIRFAAARAAAYIGDPTGAAEKTLYEFASAPAGDFQLAAVQVLGKIPNSRAVNALLRQLLDSPQTTVRIEAYSILAKAHDMSILTHVIGMARDPNDQKFAIDLVNSRGAPLIYATASGIPRIAIFGPIPEIKLPLTFGAMDNRLMIASQQAGKDVTIFYRDGHLPDAIRQTSATNLYEVISRLAGQVDDGAEPLDFTYAEVLAILQGLNDQHFLHVTSPSGEELATGFVMQDLAATSGETAPSLDRSRPQGDNKAPTLDRPSGRPAVAAPQGPVGMVPN
jgi:hypothetical protein